MNLCRGKSGSGKKDESKWSEMSMQQYVARVRTRPGIAAACTPVRHESHIWCENHLHVILHLQHWRMQIHGY